MAPDPVLNSAGGVGLLRTPTARMLPTGTLALTGEGTELDRQGTLTAQLLPRLELGLRQSQAVQNGEGIDLSPGLDAKVLVMQEDAWQPGLAMGARSVSGAARRAGEYIVASKRVWGADFSLGVGWGALAGQDRSLEDTDGMASVRDWFHGEARPFGGVQINTMLDSLSFLAEYDPDDRARERAEGSDAPSRWPVNVGVAYRPLSWVDGTLGWEQGERLMARVSLRLDPRQIRPTPKPDTPPATVLPRAGMDQRPALTDAALLNELRLNGIDAHAAQIKGKEAQAWLGDAVNQTPATAVGRTARVMANAAPADVDMLTVTLPADRLAGTAISVMRDDIRRAARSEGSPAEVWSNAEIHAGSPPEGAVSMRDRWRWDVTGLTELSPFEGTGAWVQRTMLDGGVSVQPIENLIFSGGLRATLSSNMEQYWWLREVIPHPVRSDLADYAVPGTLALEHLTATWQDSLQPDLHTRVTAGYLEEVFAGVDTEVLYKPLKARWGLGLNGAYVWKREPLSPVRLLEGETFSSAHASLYYEHPDPELDSVLSLGRYLGGDWGGTLDVGRTFDNGIRLSSFATWSVGGPADDGRLNFGLSLRIPLGPSRLDSSGFALETAVQPLTRDHGQRLENPHQLWNIVRTTEYGELVRTWPRLMD